jgi:twitching motility protein PilT
MPAHDPAASGQVLPGGDIATGASQAPAIHVHETGLIPPGGEDDSVHSMAAPGAAGFIDAGLLLRMAVAQGASDLHMRVGHPPVIRRDGRMVITKLPVITNDQMSSFFRQILPARLLPLVRGQRDYDFSIELPGLCRFRVNMFREMGRMGLVLRWVPIEIPGLQDLGLPSAVEQFCDLSQGLVLLTGPTGSGKTTTLAALLNKINLEQQRHIVTLEDPVEFVYRNQSSVVTQRQMGMDFESFPRGIRQALRQDPDVILIGEMRDRDTITTAIQAAETGHLVLSTLHTIDAVQTIKRIINAFEPHERDPVRLQLASVLQGTISQRLIPMANRDGRTACAELMVVTPAVRDYIYRDQVDEIYQLLKESRFDGMCTLNMSLYKRIRAGEITLEDALRVTENATELNQMIRGAYHGTSGMD